MRKLRNDSYARSPTVVDRRGMRPGALFILAFVSFGLLFLSRLEHGYVAQLRLQLAELMAPALKAAVVPLEPLRRAGQRLGDYLDLTGELDRLRAENQRLRGMEWRAMESERKVDQLARIANVVQEPGIDFLTARIVAHSSGPFVRSAMLGVGSDQGVRMGHAVVDASGLVGRVIETGVRASRVLLVTDISSRVPVQIGKSGVRAVLIGDNGSSPKIAYLPSDAQIEAGDEIFTSGVGGVFPRGLRIGTAIDDAGAFRMKPHARLDELDFVTILLFESPTIVLPEDERPRRPRDQANRKAAQQRGLADQMAVTP